MLNASERNRGRIRRMSLVACACIWLSCALCCYWCLDSGWDDAGIVKADEFSWETQFVITVKEYLFFTLLILATYLPVVVRARDLLANKHARRLALTVAALVVLFGFAIDAAGIAASHGLTLAELLGR